ncbi:hypothetical protein CFFPNG_04534 [Methylorubrum aminovorans]
MIALWQNTYNRVRPPAPVSLPDLAFRLPMAAAMQQPLTRLVQNTGQVSGSASSPA